MQWLLTIAAAAAVLFVLFIFLGIWAQHYVRVKPNEMLVVYGRQVQSPDGNVSGFRVVKGGGAFVFPVMEHAERVCLDVVNVAMPRLRFEDRRGKPAQANCTAQVKIRYDPDSLSAVMERFLGKSPEQIAGIVRPILEQKAGAALAHVELDEIEKNPGAQGSKVTAAVAPDMARTGIDVVSFTIEDVRTA